MAGKGKLNNSKGEDIVEISKFKSSKKSSSSKGVLELVSKEDLVEKIENLNSTVESLDKQIFEMRSLLQSGKGLGNILNLDQLFYTLMAIIREKYGLVNSSVLLVDTDDSTNEQFFRMRVHHGIPESFLNLGVQENIELFKFPATDGLLWQIIKNGESFSVQDRQRKPRFTQAWHEWNLSVLYSDIWCPLIINGKVIGIITLGPKKNGKQIQEGEFSFINDLLAIAVTNIDSVIKYENNKEILKNVQILYESHQNFSDLEDKKNLCDKSLETIVKGVNAEAGNLFLFDENVEELVLCSSYKECGDTKYITDPKYIKEAIDERKIVRINDKENIFQSPEIIINGIIINPLFRGDEFIGLIHLYNKVKVGENETYHVNPRDHFSINNESLVSGLCDQLVTNLHKLRLYEESITDKLTGLYNNAHFQKELDKYIDESLDKDLPLCVCVLDIDYFKKFNDDYGHKAGDYVLREVSRLIKSSISLEYKNLIFRYGGEEFCLILPNLNQNEAFQLVEGIRLKIEKTLLEFNSKVLKVTISGGVASLSEINATASKIFLAADEALYDSKNNGRNKISPKGQK